MKDLHIYNEYHLGDCAISLHFARKMSVFYNVYLYVNSKYIKELENHLEKELKDKVYILDLNKKPYSALNSWYGSINLEGYGFRNKTFYINERFEKFFSLLCKQHNLQIPECLLNKYCILFDSLSILESKNEIECDILFINSRPLSGQYFYNKSNLDSCIRALSEKFKIVTTAPSIDNVPCTLDFNCNLMDIANISLKTKYVIGIATAPIIPCFNKWNIDMLKKWIVLSKRSSYSYNERIIKFNDILNFKIEYL